MPSRNRGQKARKILPMAGPTKNGDILDGMELKELNAECQVRGLSRMGSIKQKKHRIRRHDTGKRCKATTGLHTTTPRSNAVPAPAPMLRFDFDEMSTAALLSECAKRDLLPASRTSVIASLRNYTASNTGHQKRSRLGNDEGEGVKADQDDDNVEDAPDYEDFEAPKESQPQSAKPSSETASEQLAVSLEKELQASTQLEIVCQEAVESLVQDFQSREMRINRQRLEEVLIHKLAAEVGFYRAGPDTQRVAHRLAQQLRSRGNTISTPTIAGGFAEKINRRKQPSTALKLWPPTRLRSNGTP